MLKQGLSQKLLQKLSPQQIQFIQLLQLNTTELEKRVEEELAENPALESERPGEEGMNDEGGDDMNRDEFKNDDSDINSSDGDNDDTDEYNDYEVDLNDYLSDDENTSDYSYESGDGGDDDRKEIPFASTTSLYENLYEQLAALRLNEREKELARHLIGMIEEDGYLRRPLKKMWMGKTLLPQWNQIYKMLSTELKRLRKILKNVKIS